MFRAAMLGLAAFEGANALVVGTPAMQVNRVSTINMANIADTLATADGPEIFWGPDGPLQNPMKEESDQTPRPTPLDSIESRRNSGLGGRTT